jgi:hypothetical protein
LKPGGYVEIRDIDPTIRHPGPITEKTFSDFALRMSELNSVDVTWTSHICEILSSQGELTDICHKKVSIGFGIDGPIATSIENSICDALRSYKNFFMEAHNLSSRECDEKINEIIQESKSYRSYFNYYMGWGRKPLVVKDTIINNNLLVPSTPIATDESTIAPFANTPMTSLTPDTSDCVNAPQLDAVELLMENAFDIVQLTQGYTE